MLCPCTSTQPWYWLTTRGGEEEVSSAIFSLPPSVTQSVSPFTHLISPHYKSANRIESTFCYIFFVVLVQSSSESEALSSSPFSHSTKTESQDQELCTCSLQCRAPAPCPWCRILVKTRPSCLTLFASATASTHSVQCTVPVWQAGARPTSSHTGPGGARIKCSCPTLAAPLPCDCRG